MGIQITEKAARQIQKSLDKRGKGIGLRIGVQTSGCSGMAYKLEYVDEAQSDDTLFEQHGVTVYIDAKSLTYLDGMTLDFVREGFKEGYVFDNPNVVEQCGCGQSFHV